MHRHHRRHFLGHTIVLPSLICKLHEHAAPLLAAQTTPAQTTPAQAATAQAATAQAATAAQPATRV